MRLLTPCALFTVLVATTAGRPSPATPSFDPRQGSLARDESQAIYSRDPADPWNRVFYLLFTRTIDARMPKDVRAPFAGGDDRLELGGQVVTRVESGDRPIDPLYPSLLWMGSTAFDVSAHDSWRTLRDPRYARLLAALSAAAAGAAARPALARALMQADRSSVRRRAADSLGWTKRRPRTSPSPATTTRSRARRSAVTASAIPSSHRSGSDVPRATARMGWG